jgi:hypothetical protein
MPANRTRIGRVQPEIEIRLRVGRSRLAIDQRVLRSCSNTSSTGDLVLSVSSLLVVMTPVDIEAERSRENWGLGEVVKLALRR